MTGIDQMNQANSQVKKTTEYFKEMHSFMLNSIRKQFDGSDLIKENCKQIIHYFELVVDSPSVYPDIENIQKEYRFFKEFFKNLVESTDVDKLKKQMSKSSTSKIEIEEIGIKKEDILKKENADQLNRIRVLEMEIKQLNEHSRSTRKDKNRLFDINQQLCKTLFELESGDKGVMSQVLKMTTEDSLSEVDKDKVCEGLQELQKTFLQRKRRISKLIETVNKKVVFPLSQKEETLIFYNILKQINKDSSVIHSEVEEDVDESINNQKDNNVEGENSENKEVSEMVIKNREEPAFTSESVVGPVSALTKDFITIERGIDDTDNFADRNMAQKEELILRNLEWNQGPNPNHTEEEQINLRKLFEVFKEARFFEYSKTDNMYLEMFGCVSQLKKFLIPNLKCKIKELKTNIANKKNEVESVENEEDNQEKILKDKLELEKLEILKEYKIDELSEMKKSLDTSEKILKSIVTCSKDIDLSLMKDKNTKNQIFKFLYSGLINNLQIENTNLSNSLKETKDKLQFNGEILMILKSRIEGFEKNKVILDQKIECCECLPENKERFKAFKELKFEELKTLNGRVSNLSSELCGLQSKYSSLEIENSGLKKRLISDNHRLDAIQEQWLTSFSKMEDQYNQKEIILNTEIEMSKEKL